MPKSPTGRLSSKGPNIQNLTPKTEEGKKIRKAFIESVERDPENDVKEVILPPGSDPFDWLIGRAFKVKVRTETSND